METSELVKKTQENLTKSMMIRSAPSGGLPIAFRSLLLALGEYTIMRGEPFDVVPANRLIGKVTSKYYIAGEGSLGKDIASMSDEPFPLITPYRKSSTLDTDVSVDKVSSFKIKSSGGSTDHRYQMVQLSRLGFEYLKNMKYFPKTYDITNNELVGINIKSHVPAELLRTTVMRTTGKGADMYPMNPAELFYTMYQMIDNYDIPVEELHAFKGFDLGNRNLTVIMKPEALVSLFDIGVCSFSTKINYDIDFDNETIVFRSFPYGITGNVFIAQIDRIVNRKKGDFGAFRVNSKDISAHYTNDVAVMFKNVRFLTHDINEVKIALESNFFKQIYANLYHFSHDVSVDIDDEKKLETGYELRSRSVREVLIECIENYKTIMASRYDGEIQEIEEKIKHYRVFEKVTRPYLAKHIQELLLDPLRVHKLKQYADMYHQQDPEQYPEITLEEIENYVWVRNSNNVLANLDKQGYQHYARLIADSLKEIDRLKKMKENIVNEAKNLFLELSQVPEFQRKSPVKFINNTLGIDKERLLDFVSIFKNSDIKRKYHYYGLSGVTYSRGPNLHKDYVPLYTIYNPERLLIQEGNMITKISANMINPIDKGVIGSNVKLVLPDKSIGLYLTNYGRLGVFNRLVEGSQLGEPLLDGEHLVDFISLSDSVNKNTLEAYTNQLVLLVKDNYLSVIPLREVMKEWIDKGAFVTDPYLDVRSMELLDDESELKSIYLWNNTVSEFIPIGNIEWKNFKTKLNIHYNPYYLIGKKEAYLNGIYLPTSVLNKLLGTNLISRKFNIDYSLPEGAEKYIAYVTEDYQDMDKLKELLDVKVAQLESQYHFKFKNDISKLACISFIREITN